MLNYKKILKYITVFSLIFVIVAVLAPKKEYALQVSKNKLDGIKGVWVASVVNIDFPKERTTDSEYMKSETIKILDNISKLGFNAVFLQVRPTADALYKSEIFPYSKYLTGAQELSPRDDFDPLEFWIQEARKRNIQIHAWINPYRITKHESGEPPEKIEALHRNNPARLHPDWVVKHGDDLYFNPGLEEVRNLILSGVTELMSKYDIDGIHLDDYFYPSSNFDDADTYAKYGNGMSLEEWRVDNVNKLVSEIHSITNLNSNVVFGISPFGIWKNKSSDELGSDTNGAQTYYQHYADSRKWVKEGMVDYILPQIYWEFGHSAADYKTLVDWWSDVVDGTNVKLIIGHAAYKQGNDNPKSAWYGEDELIRQIDYAQSKKEISGSVFFSYRSFSENPKLSEAISKRYGGSYVQPITDAQKHIDASNSNNNANADDKSTNSSSSQNSNTNNSSRLPSANQIMGENKYLKLTSHKKYSYTNKSYAQIEGNADPSKTFYINGEEIYLGTSGVFNRYLALKRGENYFTIKNADETINFVINYEVDSKTLIDESIIIDESYYPQSQIISKEYGTLSFVAHAPIGSKVVAKFNGELYELTEKSYYSGGSKDKYISKYVGSTKLPAISSDREIVNLGKVEYVVNINGSIKSGFSSGEVSVYSRSSKYYAVVSIEDADNYFKADSSQGSAHMLDKGMIDTIDEMGVYYTKLGSGYWIRTSNISSFYSDISIENTVEFKGLSKNDDEEVLSFKTSEDIAVFASMKNLNMKLEFALTNSLPSITSIASDLIRSVDMNTASNRAIYDLKLRNYDDIVGYYVQKTDDGIELHIRKKQKSTDKNHPLKNIVVMLDPGHGGDDSGTKGYNSEYPEKVYVLEASYKLKKHLENMGATVYMTRYDDETVYLADRHRASLKIKPDVFLSIHADAIGGSRVDKVMGFSIYLQNDFASALARKIKENMLAIGRTDRGIHQEDFYVTRGSWAISMLLEMGYLTNPSEYEYLKNSEKQDKQTYEIARAIVDYFEGR